MKNFWLIIPFVCILISGYSQHEPFSTYEIKRLQKIFDLTGEESDPVFPAQIKYRTNQAQPIKETYWQWDATSDTMKLFARYLNTYNPLDLLIGSLFQRWEHDHWKDELHMTQVFNEHRQEKSNQFNSWIDNSWVPAYRNYYSFNDGDTMIKRLLQDWSGDKWINALRRILEVDSFAGITIETQQNWIDDHWENIQQTTSYLNPDGTIESNLKTRWLHHNWMYEQRELFTYNEDGLVSEIVVELWDGETWSRKGIYYYEYDPSQNILSKTYLLVIPEEGEENFKWNYEYDEKGKLMKDYFSSGLDNIWGNQFQNVHTYDGEGNKTSLLTQVWIDGTWRDQEYIEFEYPPLKSLTKVNENNVAIYPNPAMDELHVLLKDKIDCPCSISISGLEGKISLMIDTPDKGYLILPTKSIAPGFNYLNLVSTNFNYSYSFIKQ